MKGFGRSASGKPMKIGHSSDGLVWPRNEPATRDWCCGMSYTQHPNHWPTKQVRLGRCPKSRQGPSPWTSILVRVFDEVLSGAQLPLEH